MTLGYSGGETLVLTQLRAISGGAWTVNNSGVGRWDFLNTGNSDHYAVLYPGAGVNEFIAASSTNKKYTTIIQIWQAYVDDGTSVTNLEAYMEAILVRFDQYRKLGDTGGTIIDSYCSHFDQPQEMWGKAGDGPYWLRQNFYIEWKEQENVTFAE